VTCRLAVSSRFRVALSSPLREARFWIVQAMVVAIVALHLAVDRYRPAGPGRPRRPAGWPGRGERPVAGPAAK
jgi:hypothetical protein